LFNKRLSKVIFDDFHRLGPIECMCCSMQNRKKQILFNLVLFKMFNLESVRFKIIPANMATMTFEITMISCSVFDV